MTHAEHKLFKKLVTIITVAGGVPFLAYPIAIEFFKSDSVLLLAPILSYSLMVVSFMSGTLWANIKSCPNLSETSKIYMILVSVAVTLFAWFSFYMSSAYSQFCIYVGLLSILLYLDYVLYKHHAIAKWYLELRVLTTIIVFTSLLYSLKFV